MAKLIVRRPRVKSFGDAIRGRRILIDGKRVASIGGAGPWKSSFRPAVTESARADILREPTRRDRAVVSRADHDRDTHDRGGSPRLLPGDGDRVDSASKLEGFPEQGARHAASEVRYRKVEWRVAFNPLEKPRIRPSALVLAGRARAAARADYHAAMKRKYEEAAAGAGSRSSPTRPSRRGRDVRPSGWLVPKSPVVTRRPAIALHIRVKVLDSPCRSDGRIDVLVIGANGLARSSFPGGISTDGVRRVLPRTFISPQHVSAVERGRCSMMILRPYAPPSCRCPPCPSPRGLSAPQ